MADVPFHCSWGSMMNELSKSARDLDHALVDIVFFLTDSWLPSEIDHAIELIEAFGPVHLQESPQRLHKMLSSQSRPSRIHAVEHFIFTTLASSTRLECEHIQLLSPPLVWFYRYCLHARTISRKFHLP